MECGDKEDDQVHRIHAIACVKSFSDGFVCNGGKKRIFCWD